MYYGDKREALVMIHGELVKRGWNVFGYRADDSDSMTDYYSPAYWEGIAEKNGFILLVDINKYDMSKSGHVISASTYKTDYSKIQKMQALANDAGATEGEKQAAQTGIDRLKAKEKENVKIISTYPTFLFENPGSSSWHVEKDGQIIAKGTGAFSVNDYDWEDKSKTEREQKSERLENLINRIEKSIKDNVTLESEIVKVPKKVISQ